MVAQRDMLEGTVSRTNSKGFTLQGREGWLNVSQYADPAPQLPAEGAKVRVTIDRSGFVRAVDALAVDGAPQNAATHAEERENAPADRETRIMRQAVLNTATAILASGSRVAEPSAVVALAARLEQWVCR